MPGYGGRFRGRDPGLYAPAPPAIPNASLQDQLQWVQQWSGRASGPCNSHCAPTLRANAPGNSHCAPTAAAGSRSKSSLKESQPRKDLGLCVRAWSVRDGPGAGLCAPTRSSIPIAPPPQFPLRPYNRGQDVYQRTSRPMENPLRGRYALRGTPYEGTARA
jgi:hypothetical protein